MSSSYLSVIGATCLIFIATLVSAQSTMKSSTPPENSSGIIKSDARNEADRTVRQRRAEARSLLISLATDARSFRDQKLRAHSLARIADVLWSVDPEQGRTLFRQAWEAAAAVEQENKVRANLRTQILTLTARRDRLLAEEFLQSVKAEEQETKLENSRNNVWALSDASQQRLGLAERLLGSGEVARALQFADPVLGNVTISTLEFLTHLRAKDPAAADHRYALMLANAGNNALADANTISLLSSYIFTPRTYITFDDNGAAESSRPASALPPANVSAELRLMFFQTASSVLLRAQPSSDLNPSATGTVGKYMVIKRLLPFFEQYAPKELREALRGQFTALSVQLGDGLREAENDWVQKEMSPDRSSADLEQPLLDQIEHARSSEEQDELYFRLALVALSKNDLKAREYVSKIDESVFRKQAQTWVDWGLANRAIKNKKTDTPIELSRAGELTHIQKVWILTQSAELLAKMDREQALSLLEEAATEARRIDGSDLDRPRAFLAIANAINLISPLRVWDALFDAVKAANGTEDFKGEDAVLTLKVITKNQIWKKIDAVSDFDIAGIFDDVANKDFERAVQLARGFRGEAPRANATIAICRSVLNEKKASFYVTNR
ncbi:MAG TPA: hypothetical protein VJ875_22555 [Pyrinomonadaceae bacterium]|nr:hypothetical protein [Pyrinomonadaceae bacterium]